MADYQRRQSASLQHQIEDMTALIAERRQRLATTDDLKEREALQQDVEQMGQQLAQLRARLGYSPEPDPEQVRGTPRASSYSSGGGTYIGPRGGCYKLTRSGKKNYSAC